MVTSHDRNHESRGPTLNGPTAICLVVLHAQTPTVHSDLHQSPRLSAIAHMNKNGHGPQVPAPKYLNDFSKALAGEVRILLAEVGKLRDERRALQFEIAELMNLKSKHGAGGEYQSDWRPKIEAPPPEEAPPAIEAPPPPSTPAPSGWRVIHKRPERRDRGERALTKVPPQTPASPGPVPEPPRPELPAWAQWRPNPLLAPTPVLPSTPPPPSRSGLFGPATPPPQ
ncbi:hypothetical protein LshimejAT787_0700010 [Lyophyllum shimeji]|uniref:Uncharacterized protein n=1 Tax=Lyophyllum shimeji TaxID=47721 RepID=A0A9P3UQR1_LYOSH|nr:hypothetical protein LshimejAT787_0700010 [Lyophyllum shimeji]